jgi:hypothetical protein
VDRQGAHKSEPNYGSTALPVKQCRVHIHSSKEEDTQGRTNLGLDHVNRGGTRLHKFLMLLDTLRSIVLSSIKTPAIHQPFL